MMSGSEAIVQSLINEGVKVVFGYPGGAVIPLYDALRAVEGKLHHVLVRHEQGAAHAAEGYARISRGVGVCIATSGPGATNLVTGIADAMLDSIPIVCITGQVGSSLLGTDAFQETDIISITIPITKWNHQVTEAEEIPYAIAKAFHVARSGRPGPVLIDITRNAQIERRSDFVFEPYVDPRPERYFPKVDEAKLAEAAGLMNAANKPLLIAGHGVIISEAEEALLAVAEKSGIPVTSTLLGLSGFPSSHPLYAGMVGMHGNYAPNMLTNRADLIIAAGMRFDDRVTGNPKTYAPNAKIIHIDVDAAEHGKNVRTSVSIVAHAKEALEKLLPLLDERKHTLWLGEFEELRKVEEERVINKDCHPGNGDHIRMGEVLRILSDTCRGEAIIVGDVGQNQMCSARYCRTVRSNSYITSGGLGTMGYALPAAIGAKFAAPDREVIAVVGDGGFQMTIQELGTVMQEGIPLKVIVLNNSFLGMVRQWQHLFFGKRYSNVSMKNPDFQKICEAYGITAETVDSRDNLHAAIERFAAGREARVLEVIVEAEANVFPMFPAGASIDEMKLERSAFAKS